LQKKSYSSAIRKSLKRERVILQIVRKLLLGVVAEEEGNSTWDSNNDTPNRKI
jgi:hypothetical protein